MVSVEGWDVPFEKQLVAQSMTSMPDWMALVTVMYAMPVVQWVCRISGISPTASLMPLMRCSASYGLMVPAMSFRQMVLKPIVLSSLHIWTYFSTVCTGLWV